MSDWRETFDILKDAHPQLIHGRDFAGGKKSMFWELLYQAFKARMKEDAQQVEKPIKDYPLEGQDG